MKLTRNDSLFVVILLTTAGYYIAGRFGLLLAVPPGYATPVWPASGLALAAALLWGYRVWPGVLIGSFLANISLGVDTSTQAALIKSLMIPFSIGSGAAIQAVAGAWLFHKFIGKTSNLDTINEIIRFLLLAPVGSSCVNATIGTGTLLLAGVVPPDNYIFNWVTWWCGDAIGILIFTIILITFFAKPYQIWRRRRYTVALPLLLAFAGMVWVYLLASSWEVRQQEARFQNQAEDIYDSLKNSVSKPTEVLYAMEGYIRSSKHVSREEFSDFLLRPLSSLPGIQALAWVPKVYGHQREQYERQARKDGHDNFIFSELDNGVLIPAKEREQYFPVFYLEPYKGNERALGFDLGSNESRRFAIDTAISTRKPTSTESIRLVQESGEQQAIIIFLPVFRSPSSDELLGLVDVVFRIGDLITSSMSEKDASSMVLSINEIGDEQTSRPLMTSAEIWPQSVEGKRVSKFTWEKSLDVGNRIWVIKLVASQTFLANARSLLPWGIMAGGLLFVGLLGVFLLSLTGEAYREKLAAKKLQDTLNKLREAQTELVQSERFASMGTMMSGLAHEINGPIGIAVTALSTLEARAKETDEKIKTGKLDMASWDSFYKVLMEAYSISMGNIKNTAQLIRSFKDVTVDRSTGEVREICLDEYIKEILGYLRPTYKKSGHSISVSCPDATRITTVPGVFSQILGNLISNSLNHGFEEGQKGKINIEVQDKEQDILIIYSDDGVGIPEESRSKVFDRYYTTKKSKGGTGLGLYLVNEIVTDQLQGSIILLDGPGTSFQISLPKNYSQPEKENGVGDSQ